MTGKIWSEPIDGHVYCILEPFDDDIPEYSALSYYCGPISLKHTLQIYLETVANPKDRAPIKVHETLWEFLDQLRTYEKAEVWFWLDFLCVLIKVTRKGEATKCSVWAASTRRP